jgi:hypothetical protein
MRANVALGGALVTVTACLLTVPPTAHGARFHQPCHPIAHRGFHNAVYDENTEASAQKSGEIDAPPEGDVRVSSDGGLFMMHDDNVRRTTDGEGSIESHDSAWAQSLSTVHGFRVPTYRQWLQAAADGGARFVVVEPKRYPQNAARWDGWGFDQMRDDAAAVGVRVYVAGTLGARTHYSQHDPNAEFLLRSDPGQNVTVDYALSHNVRMIEWPSPDATDADHVDQLRAAGIRSASRNSGVAEWPAYYADHIKFFQTNAPIAANKWCRSQS